jgi:hypothetical protein
VDEHARHRLRADHPERLHRREDGALIALIAAGLILGWNHDAVSANFGDS